MSPKVTINLTRDQGISRMTVFTCFGTKLEQPACPDPYLD